MADYLFRCTELAEAIEALIRCNGDPDAFTDHGTGFRFERLDDHPETPAFVGDRLRQHTEVSSQTVSTLRGHEQIQQDDRSSAKAGSDGPWSTGPLPSRHGMDSPNQVEPDSAGTLGRRVA